MQGTSADAENINSAVMARYYVGGGADDSAQLEAKTGLLGAMLSNPVFDELRTRQNLGYVVQLIPEGFYVTVVVQSSEYGANVVEERIDGFFAEYRPGPPGAFTWPSRLPS